MVSFAPVVFKLSRGGKPKTIIEIREELPKRMPNKVLSMGKKHRKRENRGKIEPRSASYE